MIYQEQVMQTVSYYADYSLGEADILRRAISKKKKDVLIEEEERFLRKAKALEKMKISLKSYLLRYLNLLVMDLIEVMRLLIQW